MASLQSNKAKTKNSGQGINCDGVGMCQAHSSQGLFFCLGTESETESGQAVNSHSLQVPVRTY